MVPLVKSSPFIIYLRLVCHSNSSSNSPPKPAGSGNKVGKRQQNGSLWGWKTMMGQWYLSTPHPYPVRALYYSCRLWRHFSWAFVCMACVCLRDRICICLWHLTTSWLNWCVWVCLCEMCSCHHNSTAWLMSRVCVDSVCESVECHTLFPKPLVHCWVPNWLQIPAPHHVYALKTPRDGVTSSIIFSNTSGLQQGVCLFAQRGLLELSELDCTRKVRHACLRYVPTHHFPVWYPDRWHL